MRTGATEGPLLRFVRFRSLSSVPRRKGNGLADGRHRRVRVSRGGQWPSRSQPRVRRNGHIERFPVRHPAERRDAVSCRGEGAQTSVMKRGEPDQNICPPGATCAIEASRDRIHVSVPRIPAADPLYSTSFHRSQDTDLRRPRRWPRWRVGGQRDVPTFRSLTAVDAGDPHLSRSSDQDAGRPAKSGRWPRKGRSTPTIPERDAKARDGRYKGCDVDVSACRHIDIATLQYVSAAWCRS